MGESFYILVTGASGFVGSHVSRIARAAGLGVRTHSRRPIAGINCSADLSDPLAVRTIPLERVTAVIHCAAAIPSRSGMFVRDNARAASVLADALVEAKELRRIVHVSSVSVYKRPPLGEWRISEEAEVVDPDDESAESYARSKRAAEIALDSVAARRTNVVTYQLRASSVYGPGMIGTTLLPMLTKHARNNEPLVLRGPATYRQNFIHVEDVATLAVTIAHSDGGPPGSIVNAFSDDTYGLFELADLIRTELHSTSDIVDQTERKPISVPTFENSRAKRWLPRFRRLCDHLESVGR